MKLLIVKTSSMGDVVHALPVVSDILRQQPDVQIDWLVEAPFAAIPTLNPGVRRVWPMAWRKWRGQLLQRSTWAAMSALRTQLRAEHYDLVLDLQGLLKSALWARQAHAPVAGYDRASLREPLAALAYQRTAAVARDLHAVQRCRLLASAHLGPNLGPYLGANPGANPSQFTPQGPPDFGLAVPISSWQPRALAAPYAVLIPNASRPEKLWPERNWIAVGQRMRARGRLPVVLWGRSDEQALAERIAAGCDGEVPPFLKVGEMAAVLAGAQQVVGLDTGFTHLAAAFGRPTVGIYCDHEPGLAGITGSGPVASIGGRGQVPAKEQVLALVEAQVSGAGG